MKKLLVLPVVFFAAAAFGQTAGSISSQPVPTTMSDHPLHAGPHPMATEQPIVGGGSDTYTFAQGERPLWEFGPVYVETPLGDVARAYRKEKLTAKKAEIIFEKQGS